VAFRIPNMLREIVGEGAMSSAFIPVYAEVSEARSEQEARAFVGRALGTFALILAGVTIVGILCSPLLVDLLAHKYRTIPGKFELTVVLNRWIFPYVFLVSLAAFCQAILNARHRFAVAAAAPLFLNLALILGATVIAPRLEEPTYGLAAGVLLGGLLQIAVQVPQLLRLRVVGRPAAGWKDPAVRSVLGLMTPRLFAYGINTINSVIATRFASSLGNAQVSHLYYANRLKELVLGGFAVSIATAILPLLSRQALSADRGPFKESLAFALRLIAFVTVPSTIGLIVLRVPIVRVLFEGGRFGSQDTIPTANVLGALAIGLLFFASVRVIIPAFYALKDTRMPVLAALADCVVFIALCAALSRTMGLAGIGLAASVSAAVNATVLVAVLRSREGRLHGREIAASLVRIVIASAAMAAFLAIARRWAPWESWRGGSGALALGVTIASAALVYWAVAAVTGAREPAELRAVAARRRT
jgi:putative peptidoglycan lipid II flippase